VSIPWINVPRMPTIQPAVQLYTVRSLTETDFAGTLREIARIGYTGVELAGYGNLASAAEAKKAIDDAGLKIVGAHVPIEILEGHLSKALDDQAALGNPNIICPWMPEERRTSAAAWKRTAESFNAIGAACRARGFAFAYHNHNFEFDKFDGQTAMDILWSSTDPARVRSELDVYWVKYAGEDPVDYMRKLGSRVLSLHMKDMAAGPERRFAELGSGLLDFKAIIDAAMKLGIRNFVVEQDDTYGVPPLEAIRRSLDYLKAIGVV